MSGPEGPGGGGVMVGMCSQRESPYYSPSPSFLIVNGGSHARAGPTPLWGTIYERGGVLFAPLALDDAAVRIPLRASHPPRCARLRTRHPPPRTNTLPNLDIHAFIKFAMQQRHLGLDVGLPPC